LTNSNSAFEFELFKNDLKKIRKEVCESVDSNYNDKTKLLYLVDESQYIYSNAKILEDLRYILQDQEIGIGFCFAGDHSYENSSWEKVFGGSYRDFEIIKLDYFDDVDDVKEFFTKSLESIEWSPNEIEDTLFYKFKSACAQIYELTSGRPDWINTIALKMFERCMKEESDILRFDKPAQFDVKELLENSGLIDKLKLDLVGSIPKVYQKWLSQIFASEFSTLNTVYFYAKLTLIDENFLSIDAYREFCENLIHDGIIEIIGDDTAKKIGFKSVDKVKDFLDKPYIAFGINADTIKQWLQISSGGKYKFGRMPPHYQFIEQINNDLIVELSNAYFFFEELDHDTEPFTLLGAINQINKNEFDVGNEPYQRISGLYKTLKRIDHSRERQILFAKLQDLSSGMTKAWNVYNYDDKGVLISFSYTQKRLTRFIEAVDSYKSDLHNFELLLSINSVEKPNFNNFQQSILKSRDKKKVGIIFDDQMSDLIDAYITHADIAKSYEIANFFFELYDEGFDLDPRMLNNSAYVFLTKDETDKANQMLIEAKRKIFKDEIEGEDYSNILLVLYNLAMVQIKMKDYQEGLSGFKSIISYANIYNKADDDAGALHLLSLNETGEIIIDEIKEKVPKISIKAFAENNIRIIEEYFNKKEGH